MIQPDRELRRTLPHKDGFDRGYVILGMVVMVIPGDWDPCHPKTRWVSF